MKKLIFAATMLVSMASPAFATCTTGLCSNSVIEYLYIKRSNGNVYIKLDDAQATSAILGCTLDSGLYMTLTHGADGSQEIYAALLSAFLNGTPVDRIRIINGSTGCEVDYIFS